MDSANVANLVGAFSTFVADTQRAAIRVPGLEQSQTVALLLLAKYPGATIDALREPLELTHSGCVRLVDRLVEAGFVVRRAAEDARAVALHLTRNGREAAATAQEVRAKALARALHVLTPREQELLGKVIHKILTSEVATLSMAARTCRLCDYGACVECPCHEVA